MTCRRVSRELLERFRFGETLDWHSDPHLRHLETCGACRQAVGLDRALVIQLRRTLHQRVAGRSPSASSWQTVRQRALELDAAPSWSDRLIRWARVVPVATVAVGLMLIAVTMARESDRPRLLQPVAWPGFQERAADVPGPLLPLTFRYGSGPQPSAPATGLTVFDDPSRRPRPQAIPVSGLLP